MLHLGHGYMGRVRVAEYYHSERITDQDERDPRLIEQAGHREIVGREGGNSLSAALAFAKAFNRFFLSFHKMHLDSDSGQLRWGHLDARGKLASNSPGETVAVPILPTTIPAA